MPTDLSVDDDHSLECEKVLLDKISQSDWPSGTRRQSVDLIVRNLGRGGRE